jgi:hypothetical protein
MQDQFEFFDLKDIIKIYQEDKNHRKCRACNIVKEIEKFSFTHNRYEHDSTKGRSYTCTQCKKEQGSLINSIKKIHPVPPPGPCPICFTFVDGKKRNIWNVDHCHKTKTFRGYICGFCNVGLGHFKDCSQNLKRASEYLSSFHPKKD